MAMRRDTRALLDAVGGILLYDLAASSYGR